MGLAVVKLTQIMLNKTKVSSKKGMYWSSLGNVKEN